MENKKKWAGWIVLTVIAATAAVALAFTNQVTEEPIAQQNMASVQGALKELFPEAQASDFEAITLEDSDELMAAYTVHSGNQTLGYAAQVASQGYAGPIEIVVGMEPDFVLRGISVGGSDFKETEGLGSKAREPEFTDQFKGKQPPVTVGDNIDAISGATITSTAVTEGVNQAVDSLKAHLGEGNGVPEQGMPETPGPLTGIAQADRTVNASVIGYGGPVLVRLTLDDQGAIADLQIGGPRMMETPGLGARVTEQSFIQQFIGKTPPLEEGDIELLSGATVSSKAAVEAVNAAAAFLDEQ
ncbi:MAG: FMN-binding protein [Clostridiales bacterium]|nr:FMN-binding protein [Clostridiales bacterium]